MSFEEFQASFCDEKSAGGLTLRERIQFLASKEDNVHDRIFVFFHGDSKVTGGDINDKYKSNMEEAKVTRAILVFNGAMTSMAAKAIQAISSEMIIEYFKESELIVNITEHKWVPQHYPLSVEEVDALLARYKAKLTQLPRMSIMDPISRYYGLAVGDVVKIVRRSETAGRYVTYRRVIRET